MFHGDNLEYKSSIHKDPQSTIDFCRHYCCWRANGIDLCPCHILINRFPIEVHNMEMHVQEEERGRGDNKIDIGKARQTVLPH